MRPEKASIVSDLSEKLNRSPFLLVTDYQRMKVDQFGELRNRLAPAGAEVRVVKNSFLKRAMADSGMPDVGDKLTGQTAIVMGEKDVAPVAKILKLFAAEFKIATLKIGVVDKAVMSTADVEALAELPSREILLSQLLGLLLAPATRLVRVLNEPASAFARLLKAKGQKGEAAEVAASVPAATENESPAPEAKSEEAPAAEVQPESTAAETKEVPPVAEVQAEQTPAAAPEDAAKSTQGETSTETPA
ncbi:MAG: large subunit ribosomal protein [Verrucomicrobiota bacterium]